jgi:hypothetical protein
VTSDTHPTPDRQLGGLRPGRTAAEHRGGGDVGHAVPGPCRPTVLDKRRQPGACGSAASLGGDVGGTNQVPVPLERAVRTGESAAVRLGDPPVADRAGGRGAALIHQPHYDACLLGLVPQGLHKVGAAPLPQPPVLHPARILLGDPPRVPDHQRADLVVDGEGDHLLGGLVLGLMDAAAMACLHPPQPRPVATPAPRPALPRPGRAAGGLGLAGLLICTVQVALGPDGPPRHQQPSVLGHDRVGVDDPKINPGHPTRIQVVLLDGDGGGDRQPQPPTIGQQRHRPDLLGRIGEGSGQPHPQLGLALSDRQPHPLALYAECAVVGADRDQRPLAPREPSLARLTTAVGGLEPGVGVAAQHRPCPHRRQLPKAVGLGQLPAQRLVVADCGFVPLVALPVAVQQPRPHVPGRPQQPVATAGLPTGGAQADVGSAMQQARSGGSGHGELMFDS